jgi:signal transduction histidine kinase
MRPRPSGVSVLQMAEPLRALAPPRRDLLLALALVAVGEVEVATEHLHPYPASVTMFVILMGALAWRRRAPFVVVAVGFAATLIAAGFGVSQHKPFSPILGIFVALYSLALYATSRRALLGLMYTAGCVYSQIALAMHHGESYGGTDFGFIAVLLLAPWLVGKAMRGRVAHMDALERRAEQAEQERERRAEEAAREERARIARELHDVIAHSVSVMVVQAGAAEEVLRLTPEQALQPIRAVQETGRAALAEMARLLGMLRRDGGELGLEPQPGLDEIDALLEQTRRGGLPVDLLREGERRPLPLGVDLSAYRIVQEALTNTRKHADRPARATVTIRYAAEALEIEVVDDGTSGTARNGSGGGHGMVGMRERVALFGGEFDAGPTPAGGFRVRARLPIGEPG